MKKGTLIGLLIGVPLAILVIVASSHFPGPGEQALATARVERTPTPVSKPASVSPEGCVLPPYDNPPKVTIGREGRDGQVIDCALRAFRELFPGCGDPTTNPEDFSTELFLAWLVSNGFDVENLPDSNGDGIPDPILYPNQVLTGKWGW